VTARLVLVNVPRPEEIVREAVALARPGGFVALHEGDWGAHIVDPPLPAWDDFAVLFDRYARANEMDLCVGRRLPRMLREAGLVDVQVRPFVHVYPPGHGRRTIYLEFRRQPAGSAAGAAADHGRCARGDGVRAPPPPRRPRNARAVAPVRAGVGAEAGAPIGRARAIVLSSDR
jgi:hypothetical protein